MKNQNGITLIALVITIIILLLLAGLSISTLTESGLINKTIQAKLENKRAQISENLKLKLTTEKTNNPFGSAEEVVKATRDNVIKNIDDLKQFGKDIIIGEVSTEEDYKTVDAYFYVTVDDDIYKVELNGVTFVGERDNLAPIIKITKIENTTNTITVEVETQRNEGGKIEYYIKGEDDTEYKLIKTIKENTFIYEGLEHSKKYSIKVVAIAKNKKTAEATAERILGQVADLTTANVEFEYNPSTWTNREVIATVKITDKDNTELSKYTIQTSKDNKIFTSTASQTFTENGTMYVRLTDGTNVGGTATGSITNIDKAKPLVTDVTVTTNSITITATDEESGIIGYAVTTNATAPTSFTSVTNKKSLSTTVTGINSGTTYYVWVKDEAGNINESKSVMTEKVIIETSNYKGVYDGKSHSATVRSLEEGVTLTYGTVENSYTLSSIPSYTNAGLYNIYWKATRNNEIIKTGMVTVEITKADATISITASNGYITVTSNSDGAVSATSSDESIAYAVVAERSVRVVPVHNGNSGTLTITTHVTESANYKASQTKTQSVTISQKLITSSLGWDESHGYWSGAYQYNGTWWTDTNSMWHTTDIIQVDPGCYYIIGGTGGLPRIVVWNNKNKTSLVAAYQANGNPGTTFTVDGNYYIQIPMLVSGNRSNTPVKWTGYDFRKIIFN